MSTLARWRVLSAGVALLLGAGCSTPAASGSVASPSIVAETSAGAAASSGASVTFTVVATHELSDSAAWYLCCYIDIGPDGELYLPEAGRSEILVLDVGGAVVRRWGAPGTDLGQFGFHRTGDLESAIGGIAVTADGSAYVVEAGNKRVQFFDASGQAQLAWGSPGTGDGQFLDPIGVAVSSSGEVFVVDDERDDIQVFTPNGDYLRTIGRQGSEPGELFDTGTIRIGPDDILVNADFGNSRVQAWDAEGDFLWSLGSHGTGPGQFVEPQDVAFGSDGSLFVVDDSRVQVFDSEMRLIGTWPDEPSPDHLASIALSGDTMWVVAPYIDTLFEVRVRPAQP